MITPNTTHQQTKTVVNTVAGTYQTVLTISQSVSQSDIPRLYSCTVENARGRSSRAVVIPGNGEFMINKYNLSPRQHIRMLLVSLFYSDIVRS